MQSENEIQRGRTPRQTVRKVPLRRAFIGNFLDKGFRPRGRMKTNSDVSNFLRTAALLDLGGTPIEGPDPVTDEKVARTMAAEVIAAVQRIGGKSGMHWYTESIHRTIRVVALMHPEIVDDEAARAVPGAGFKSAADARTVLFCAMAITSQNIPVNENMGYALEQYRAFVQQGRFRVKGYGIRGASVRNNLERCNRLLDVLDGSIERLRNFLGSEFTMRDLRQAAEKVGMTIASRALMDEKVYGSFVFGPKIGNGFYQNLTGRFGVDNVTIDLWFTRTWGRYTGTLVRNTLTGEQVQRLSDGLKNMSDEFAARAAEAGLDIDAEAVLDMESGELIELCRSLILVWERERRAKVKDGATNAEMSALKATLGWPGAADSIRSSMAETVDAPTSAGQRKWMRSVVARALEILDGHGYALTAAEAQALLWIPEKELYLFLRGREYRATTRNFSYDDAVVQIAKKAGIDEREIQRAVGAMDGNGLGRRDVPDDPRFDAAGAVQGVHQGAGEHLGQARQVLGGAAPDDTILGDGPELASESDEEALHEHAPATP